MNIKNEFFLVVGSDDQICWAVQLDDGSLILMDRDMRIVDNNPWHYKGMGFSGEEKTLEEYVDSWIHWEDYYASLKKGSQVQLVTKPTEDF